MSQLDCGNLGLKSGLFTPEKSHAKMKDIGAGRVQSRGDKKRQDNSNIIVNLYYTVLYCITIGREGNALLYYSSIALKWMDVLASKSILLITLLFVLVQQPFDCSSNKCRF